MDGVGILSSEDGALARLGKSMGVGGDSCVQARSIQQFQSILRPLAGRFPFLLPTFHLSFLYCSDISSLEEAPPHTADTTTRQSEAKCVLLSSLLGLPPPPAFAPAFAERCPMCPSSRPQKNSLAASSSVPIRSMEGGYTQRGELVPSLPPPGCKSCEWKSPA